MLISVPFILCRTQVLTSYSTGVEREGGDGEERRGEGRRGDGR